jgi:hypothetical protein
MTLETGCGFLDVGFTRTAEYVFVAHWMAKKLAVLPRPKLVPLCWASGKYHVESRKSLVVALGKWGSGRQFTGRGCGRLGHLCLHQEGQSETVTWLRLHFLGAWLGQSVSSRNTETRGKNLAAH